MKLILNRLVIPVTIFLGVAIVKTATAGEVPAQDSRSGQFIIQLPDVDRETLIDQVTMLRSQLIARKQALATRVADSKLDGGDAIITAIMPGGLLYAGYKKARHEQARTELARVSDDIETLSGDLLAVQSRTGPTVIADLH